MFRLLFLLKPHNICIRIIFTVRPIMLFEYLFNSTIFQIDKFFYQDNLSNLGKKKNFFFQKVEQIPLLIHEMAIFKYKNVYEIFF